MANSTQQAEAIVTALEQAAGQGYADREVMVATVLKTLAATAPKPAGKKPGPKPGSIPKVSAFRIFQDERLVEWYALKEAAVASKAPTPDYKLWLAENISAPWAQIKADKTRMAEYQKLADISNAPAVPTQ